MKNQSFMLIVALVWSKCVAERDAAGFLPPPRNDGRHLDSQRRRTYFDRRTSNERFVSLGDLSRKVVLQPLQVGSGDDTSGTTQRTRIVFPGGGIFFYWQAGAVSQLREDGYDLNKVDLSGASAGALAATLTAAGVDFHDATALALDKAHKAGVWDRPLGLQGIWGAMIEEWLDELLPENAVEMLDNRLSLLVTPVPTFGKSRISEFENKEDLIKANMASVHLPWFLNGKLFSDFRGLSHIDGSFLAQTKDYYPNEYDEMASNLVVLDWKKDPIMTEKAHEFVKVVSKEGIWDMVEQGKSYAKEMELQGDFDVLPRE